MTEMTVLMDGCCSAHPSLLPHAIESGNLVLLESILRHVPDLLEEHLLMCLKLILLNIHKHSMDALITHWAAAAPTSPVVDHDAVRRHLLDLVLLAPKGDVFALGCVAVPALCRVSRVLVLPTLVLTRCISVHAFVQITGRW